MVMREAELLVMSLGLCLVVISRMLMDIKLVHLALSKGYTCISIVVRPHLATRNPTAVHLIASFLTSHFFSATKSPPQCLPAAPSSTANPSMKPFHSSLHLLFVEACIYRRTIQRLSGKSTT